MNRALEEYRFNDAASSIYQFVWHELCDWYIEMAKIELQNPQLEAGATMVPPLRARRIVKAAPPFHAFCHRGDMAEDKVGKSLSEESGR